MIVNKWRVPSLHIDCAGTDWCNIQAGQSNQHKSNGFVNTEFFAMRQYNRPLRRSRSINREYFFHDTPPGQIIDHQTNRSHTWCKNAAINPLLMNWIQ